MCWNEHVSLNTFLFSTGVLALGMYNYAAQTPYQVRSIQGTMGLFIATVAAMQLVEYFLWRNLKRPFWNRLFSGIGLGLLFLQPFAAIAMIPETTARIQWLTVYTVLFGGLLLWYARDLRLETGVSPSGHLSWHWANFFQQPWLWIVYMVFFFGGLWRSGAKDAFFVGGTMMIVSAIGFLRDRSFGSMWCWLANLVTLWAAIQMLVVKPLCEGKC